MNAARAALPALALAAASVVCGSSASSLPAALPGAEPHPPALRAALAQALTAQGSDYEPRSRHRGPDGSPVYTNRLLLEQSPYLRQHAHNPVDWRPWGDEAFEAARRLQRPVLVSIGYSTCHWCHVMEDETYDDPEVAAALNAGFIAIKVDREERPDVDSVYMTALHTLRGSGGWPLNVWVTPDREPFYGATYIPRDRFLKTIASITEEWNARRTRLDSSARRLGAFVARQLAGSPALASWPVDSAPLHTAAASSAVRFDPKWGGALGPRKFPSGFPLRFLLRYHRRTGDPEALHSVVLTLERIAAGGIRDHVGGGFHRYSVDPRWEVPHFEKMLYDNALLSSAYLETWQATGRTDFADVVRETLDYLAREMSAADGGFFSATDADSLNPDGEREEGAFFTWSAAQLRAVLGDDARGVITWYGVGVEPGVLHVVGEHPPADLAGKLLRLRRARARRPPPLRDEKVLAAWNGLAISAFAQAGFALERADYVERARRAARFLLDDRRADGRLRRVAGGDGPAFLEDYAFVVAALLDLYEADADPAWLREAVGLQALQDLRYADAVGGAYFRSADDAPTLLAREKTAADSALPSGNSVAARNLLRLHAFTGTPAYAERVSHLFSAFAAGLRTQPTAHAELLLALDFALEPTREVVVVTGSGLETLLVPVRRTHAPNRAFALVEPAAIDALKKTIPWVEHRAARGGRATAYVCRNRVCNAPTEDPAVLKRQLAQSEPLPRPAP